MSVLFVVALLFVAATAQPNRGWPPVSGGNSPFGSGGGGPMGGGPMGGGPMGGGPMGGGPMGGGPMGGGPMGGGPMGGGPMGGGPVGGGPMGGGPMGGGPMGGGPMGGGPMGGGPMGGGPMGGGPMGGGPMGGGPMGGGPMGGGPMGGGPMGGGPMGGGPVGGGPTGRRPLRELVPEELNSRLYPVDAWDLRYVPVSEVESYYAPPRDFESLSRGVDFEPVDSYGPRYPRAWGGPRGHGDRRPPFPPGRPHHPPPPRPRPDGGRPNITFTSLFRTDNVTVQNISAAVPLKVGENIFILPPNGGGPPVGNAPPVFGSQPYFKINYNPNATQSVSFEFGVAKIQFPSSLRSGSESDEFWPL